MPYESEVAVHMKRTPVSSKAWKEKLRQGCLERLKGRKKSPSGLVASSTSMSIARRIVEEEMMDLGVAVDSPCIDQKRQRFTNVENIMTIMIGEDVGSEPHGHLTPKAHHFISEEELFELLAEIEQEMDADDIDHYQYEEMLALADVEECEFEDRVIKFQEQGDHTNPDMNEGVLCPLCKDAFVRQEKHGALACPNTMDSSCDLCITNGLGLTLENFKERLQEAYEQHAVYCSQNLSFQTGPCPLNEAMNLFAVCFCCETRMLIA